MVTDAAGYERIRQQAEDIFYGNGANEAKLVALNRLLLLSPEHGDVLGYLEGVSMEMSDGPLPGDIDLVKDVSFSVDMTEAEAFAESQSEEERLDNEDD